MQMRPTNAMSEQSGSTPVQSFDVMHSSEQNDPESGGPSTHTALAQSLPEAHGSTPFFPVPRTPGWHAQPVVSLHSQRSARRQSRLNEHIAPLAPGPSTLPDAAPSLPLSRLPSSLAPSPDAVTPPLVVPLLEAHAARSPIANAVAAAAAENARRAPRPAGRGSMSATCATRIAPVPRNLARVAARA